MNEDFEKLNLDAIERKLLTVDDMKDICIKEEKNNLLLLYSHTNDCHGLGKKIEGNIYAITNINHSFVRLLKNNMAVIMETMGVEALVDENANIVVPYGKYEGFGKDYDNCILVYEGPKIGLIRKPMGEEILGLQFEKIKRDVGVKDQNLLYLKDEDGDSWVYSVETDEFDSYYETDKTKSKRRIEKL